MKKKHAHIDLALAQRAQKTLLCPGPCPHMFDSREANQAVYGQLKKGETFDYYDTLLGLTPMGSKSKVKMRKVYSGLLAGAENYTKMMLQIWIEVCGLRTFKDQDGVVINHLKI